MATWTGLSLAILAILLSLEFCSVEGYGADNAISSRNTALKRLKDSCLLPPHLRSVECCFNDDDWAELGVVGHTASSRCEFDEATQSFPCAIRLGVNNWDGSFATAYVAKIFIEEYLGWPVEIRAESPTDGTVGTQDITDVLTGEVLIEGQWELMSTGLIDAILEIWPSGHAANEFKYVKQLGTVVNAGLLGINAKIGWFFPSFLLTSDRHNIVGPSEHIEFWRSLVENEHVFEDPVSERPCCPAENGAFVNTSHICMAPEVEGGVPVEFGGFENAAACDADPGKVIPTYAGRFLTGAESWSTLDDHMIRNLGLNFTIQFAQTEANLISEMTKMIEEDKGLIMYFWRPHGIFRKLNLSSSLLPHFDPTCFDNIENYACDYPNDVLFKAYSKTIRNDKPDLADFFEIFNFKGGDDQEELMANFLFGDVQDWNNVTCEWLKKDIRKQLGPDSRFEEWKSFLDSQFQNQIWQDVAPEPVLEACACNKNNERHIVQYFQLAEVLEGVDFEVDEDFCSGEGSKGLYTTRWTSQEYPTKIIESVSCNFVHHESETGAIMMSAIGLSCLTILLLSLSVLHFRDSQIMRASSRRTMGVFLSGALFLNLVSVTAIGVAPSFTSCFLRAIFLTYGASWFIGSLLIKEFYLYRLFYPLVITSKNTLRTQILTHQLLVTSLLPSAIIVIWAIVSGFDPVDEPIVLSSGEETDAVEKVCPSNDLITGAVAIVFVLAVLLCCAMSYYTRKIPGLFSEARFVTLSSYNILVFVVAVGIIASSITLSNSERELIFALALAWVTLISSLMIVGTRTYVAMKGISFELHFETDPRTGSFVAKVEQKMTSQYSSGHAESSPPSYTSKFKGNVSKGNVSDEI